MEKHPLHMKSPELQTSPEVNRAVERKTRRTGERVPNDPSARIEAYMDRLEHIFLNPKKMRFGETVGRRNLEMFREKIYDAFIIKKENFPESYFELQKRIAREQGHGDVEISEEMRDRMIETAIKDQKASLDAWMDYLAEEDVAYPTWFRFYAWSQITKLSQFDKELGKFKSRTESTVGRFPDIHRAALAKILDTYKEYPRIRREIEKQTQPLKAKKAELKARRKVVANEAEAVAIDEEIQAIDQETSRIFQPLTDFNTKFPELYAEIVARGLAMEVENQEEIRGEWVRYGANDSAAAERLWKSVEGRTGAAGWCIEGKETAHNYNQAGDFYVYYTYDEDGNPTQPRLAIQMNGGQIGQIRGLLVHQGVEPLMQSVLDAKLSEFGGEADAYRKKSEDMRLLTALERKREQGEPFTKEDLVFLYEVNGRIEGFGYGDDPRVKELRRERNVEEDMLVIFECAKEEIAHVPGEITAQTKAYVGPLEPGVFQKLPEHLEHVYTSFPDKKIRREHVEIGGKTAEQLIQELEAAGINISDYARYILKSHDFKPGEKSEAATLIHLTVHDLGFATKATTDQIYRRAEALGLELCPSDVAPHYRLKYKSQPLNEWVYVGMKQITGPGGSPLVFELGRGVDGLWLSSFWAKPDDEWNPDDPFVFRLHKSKS